MERVASRESDHFVLGLAAKQNFTGWIEHDLHAFFSFERERAGKGNGACRAEAHGENCNGELPVFDGASDAAAVLCERVLQFKLKTQVNAAGLTACDEIADRV